MNIAKTRTVVPPGLYFIGDPCYAIPDSDWMTWLEAGDFQNERWLVEADLGDGKYAVALGTAYGDGQYDGSDDFSYPVDAGLIGLTSARWPYNTILHSVDEKLGRYIDIPEESVVEYVNGVLTLGPVVINTGYDDEQQHECPMCGERHDGRDTGTEFCSYECEEEDEYQ